MAEADDLAVRAGLLLEPVERLQREADAAVERLAALSRELEQVVRDEIRAAFVEEFEALGAASRRAGEALDAVRRTASMRLAAWAVAVVASCAVVPLGLARAILPSRAEVERLRGERDALAADVARLAHQGGRIDLRRCGAAGRLCARVDRSAPAYGSDRDYFVLEGY